MDEKGQEYYVCRKKLEDITPAMIKKEKIVDPVVQQIIKDRLTEYSIEPEKANNIPKEVWNKPLYMKTTKSKKKVPIKKVRIRDVFNNMILLKDKSGKPYRAVAPGNNHHIEIFEYKDKKGQTKRDGKVVTMFEAVQRSQRGESVVCRDYKNGKKFVCSLAQNELFMIELNDDSTELHRVQKITQSGNNITITLRPHTYAGKVSDSDKPPLVQRRSPNTLKGHKVTVDMLGRVHLAND
jgi:CRISPR-associated endonuclease Csn1